MTEAAQATAKQLLPDQCLPLHYLYGPQDCCFCRSQGENAVLRLRVQALEYEVAEWKQRQVGLMKRRRTAAKRAKR